MSKHYVAEAGTELILDTGILIGSATQQYIKYRKPDGTTSGSFAASLYSSYSQLAGTIGTYLLKYTLLTTDLNQPGEWRFQAYIGAVGGTWLGEMIKVNIYDAFE
jgi:hypothetical protein